MKLKIYLGGDHAGFELKEKVKSFLKKEKIRFEDLGPLEYNPKDDYPDFVIPLARKVSKEKNSIGIIFAGSGQGEAIATNKIKGIGAAVYYGKNLKIVKLAREHNNANILSIGARFASFRETKKAINIFLKEKFQKGRHQKRLEKVNRLGSK